MKSASQIYVWAGKRFPFLDPILREWCSLNLKYAMEHKQQGDVPWWYGERTHIGFLSAAAWLHGSIALEEWGTVKTRNRRKSAGRGDLYILSDDRQHRLCCEAKKITLRAERGRERWEKQVTAALKSALRDSRCVRPSKSDVGVGIVFAEVVMSSGSGAPKEMQRAIA